MHDIDNEIEDQPTAEAELRAVLAWARAESASATDQIQARSMAILATKVEDALRTLLLPIP